MLNFKSTNTLPLLTVKQTHGSQGFLYTCRKTEKIHQPLLSRPFRQRDSTAVADDTLQNAVVPPHIMKTQPLQVSL